jgi:hypothetical protein
MYRGHEKWIQSFVKKPEGKRPLVRARSRWNNNIKIDLREVGWEHEPDR